MARLDEPLEVEGNHVGLAGPGRQLHEEPALAELDRPVQCAHGVLLVGAHRPRLPLADVVVWDRDGRKRSSRRTHLDQALEVAT